MKVSSTIFLIFDSEIPICLKISIEFTSVLYKVTIELSSIGLSSKSTAK